MSNVKNRERASATTLAAEVSENELAALKALLKVRRLKGPHLEIGTAAGGTLKELMRCYPDAARPRFVVVDPMQYFFDQLAIVRKNLASAGLDPDKVDFRVGMSWPAFRQASRAGERFSFIFEGRHHNYRVVGKVDSLLIVEKTAASVAKEIGAWDRLRARITNVLHKMRVSVRKRMRRAAGS